ncbi:MAG: MMPL family transporter, partial [Actinomycetota bacterium]|nr:MMPL family transporter [Actinomycetota bacterium]
MATVGVWLLVLVATFFASSSSGSHYAAGTKLSGTQSAAAANLLQKAAPGQAGDSEQIVFQATSGKVTSPAVQSNVQAMLAQVGHLPYVSSVTSPYSTAGAHQISENQRIAFATVDFTKDANLISQPEATTFVHEARAPNSSAVQVDVVGGVASSTNPSSSSLTTVYGVAAALIILLLVFGSLWVALLPLLSTGIALIAALSVVGVLSNSLSMASFTSQLSILIGLGVGIDYSLFVLTRTRSGLRKGMTVPEAVEMASATAGRAVLFAGITVCIALLGMLTVGVSVLSGAAIAASISVLFPLAAALTLLPAFIGLLGKRTLTRRQRAMLARGETNVPEASKAWASWASRVQAHKIGFAVAA